MSTASVTYTFTAGNRAVASQVNTNFSDLVSYINTNAIVKDGAVSMTGALNLSGDPTSANHAVRKSYVDPIYTAKLTGSYDIGTIASNFYIPPTFTMPTIPSGGGLRFEFFVPRWYSSIPLGGSNITVTFEKTDGTDLNVFQFYSFGLGSYEASSLLWRYDTYDNSVWAGGASVAVRFNGVSDVSGFRFQGSATAPIFYTVGHIG